MRYIINESQHSKLEKVIYKFLDLTYSGCKMVKIGTYDALIGDSKDDTKFTVSLRGTMDTFDSIDFKVFKMFGSNVGVFEPIFKKWVKDRFDIDVRNIVFS